MATCNKCGGKNLTTQTVMDFKFHKCSDCGNQQKIN